jgi:hypothetical protein
MPGSGGERGAFQHCGILPRFPLCEDLQHSLLLCFEAGDSRHGGGCDGAAGLGPSEDAVELHLGRAQQMRERRRPKTLAGTCTVTASAIGRSDTIWYLERRTLAQ